MAHQLSSSLSPRLESMTTCRLAKRSGRPMRIGFEGDAKDFVLVADKVNQISRECMAIKIDKSASAQSGGTERMLGLNDRAMTR